MPLNPIPLLLVELSTLLKPVLVKKWASENLTELGGHIHLRHHEHFTSLQQQLLQTDASRHAKQLVMLDTENEFFYEYLLQLKQSTNGVKIIAVGFPKDIISVRNYLSKGANAWLDITSQGLEVAKCIHALAEQEVYLPSPEMSRLLALLLREQREQQQTEIITTQLLKRPLSSYELTQKESVVVEYLLKGYPFKQIAELLGVSSFAINQRTKSIYKKCGVRSRNELSYLLLR